MHPPFFVVDHRIDLHERHAPHGRVVIRRSQPEVLRLNVPAPCAPVVTASPARVGQPGGINRAGWLARLFRGLRHAPA